MSEPTVAQKAPYPVDVEEGKKYFWCSCGKSSKQPFCDGSHEGQLIFYPWPIPRRSTRTLYFCGCKHTAGAPSV